MDDICIHKKIRFPRNLKNKKRLCVPGDICFLQVSFALKNSFRMRKSLEAMH